ncbi:MAG: DeoR family transcriptional regulator [Prevotella sp.]|uniref:DeoR family transcriptional regulator n=1 Tax=Prevotella dentalis TaxID=52227 RepID=UPI003B4E7646|nr:DeoR family transcriptional regulator [Prevotella dentalis]
MSVLENVLKNVLGTSASLAKYFKVDARTIRRDLSVLQTKGFIRHDGPRWVVIKG